MKPSFIDESDKVKQIVKEEISKLKKESDIVDGSKGKGKLAALITDIKATGSATGSTGSTTGSITGPVSESTMAVPIPDGSIHKHDSDISCPECGIGHIHQLKESESGGSGSGLVYKCTGPNCGEEYVMISKNSDFKCATCGVPIKRPSEGSKIQVSSCPFCSGRKAAKFNWNGLWNARNR